MKVSKILAALLFVALVIGFSATAFSGNHSEGHAHDGEASGEKYQLDPVHSSAVFRIKHLDVGYVFGMFREVDGSFTFDEANPAASEFSFSMNTASVFTNHQQRDDHLRSPDFFAAEEHPEMTFQSTSVEETHPGTYRIRGDFTLRGVTQEIEVIADKTGEGQGMRGEERIGFNTTFAVNRMTHGVDFMPDGLGEHVRVMFSIQGIKQ